MRYIGQEEFEAFADSAFGRLPEKFRHLVENVAILVEDVVDDETVRELNLPSNKALLGLYKGVPRTERGNDVGFELPDVIVLYKIPIEEYAHERGRSVEDVVYETLWHEIGHHFGLDEERVQMREEEEFGEN